MYFCVALLMYLCVMSCCVFDSVCELFGETIRNVAVVAVLLLKQTLDQMKIYINCGIGI